MEEFKAYAASLGIGLSLGLIGAGGSILSIPVFVYILRKDPLSSAVYSMFVVAISCMVGSIRSMRNKLIDGKTILAFGVPSVIGVLIARRLIFPSIPSQLGSVASRILSKDMVFMLCLSAVMLLAGFSMLRSSTRNGDAVVADRPPVTWLLLRGLFVGIVTGLLGIGGGFLIVPALYFLARLPMKRAIGNALVIITINASFGFLASFHTVYIDWHLLLKFSVGAIAGIFIGTKLSAKMPAYWLKKIFGWFILCLSVYIIYKQFVF